jgi:predicted dehydrogenase
MSQPLNIAVIGCGFMGRAHSNAWSQVTHFFPREHKPVLKVCCARPEEKDKLEKFCQMWGYQSMELDWKKVIERKDVDLIDVCVPNNMHRDIVIAAAQAGKMVVCEKPLAMTTAEGEEMVAAVEKAGVANMVSFNYRRVPAISLAKQIINEGRIGRPFHYRATYLQDYTIAADVPQGGMALWRLDARVAGSGVTGDLLAHSIDTAEWLNGPIQRVVAYTETFIKERKHAETGKVEPVTIDDACMFLAIFANGSMGTFESTRYARGRKNYNTFELNGENGAVFFNLEEPHMIKYFRYADPQSGKKIEDHLTGWQDIMVTNFEHPYMRNWWVPGCTIGYEHTFINSFADFLAGLEGGPAFQPNMRSALRTQKVCDAVLESAKRGQWVEIPAA